MPDARHPPDARRPAPAHDALFDEAVGLVIRLQENPRDAATKATLARWRRRSPRHERAWAEAQAIHDLSGRALARARPVSRRGMLRAAAWGGVAALGGWTVLPQAILAARADHRTGIAEIRDVALPGGSRITLAPETAVAADVAAGRPRLRLLAGTLWCDIPASGVPLSVRAREATLTTGGAAFELAEGRHGVQIAVASGRVALAAPGRAEMLAADEWLRLAGDSTIRRGRQAGDIEPAAWRNSRLQADAEPIASLVERIAPWLPGRIVLASAELGRRRVSGVFDLADPLAALRAAVWPHGGRVRRLGPLLTVITAL